MEKRPAETKPKTLDDIKAEDGLIARAKAGQLTAAAPAGGPVTAPAPAAEAKAGETPIVAPMPGLILSYEVKVGDEVKTGDNIVVLEAMKMAIDLPTPVDGRVKSLGLKPGDHVTQGDVLAIIG